MFATVRSLWVLTLLAYCLPAGCQKKSADEAKAATYPHLLYRPEHKPLIRKRLTREPYKTVLANLRNVAAEKPGVQEGDEWNAGMWGNNGNIALDNAILAWVFDDEAAAKKAKAVLLSLDTHFETNKSFDVNITMPRVLVPFSCALDILLATPWLTAAEAKDARERIGTVADKFATKYLDNPLYRYTALVVTQNNHPMRTASALGFAALAAHDHPNARRWLNWAVSEMDYLLKERGHYIQPDGAISEGPFYGQYGLSAAYPFIIALDNAYPKGLPIDRSCLSRNKKDPWTDHGCVEGERYIFENPLRLSLLRKAADWLVAMRKPSGMRAYISDSKDASLLGSALLTGYGAPGYLAWDWENHEELPKEMEKFFYLAPWYLAYLDDTTPATQPEWKNRFYETSGYAVFRSGWERDDLWLALVSDGGPARKTLHNHGDATSFSLSAYGEELLIDPGYYKKDELNNPETTNFPSHNVVLVDGKGPLLRGLLDDFGDTDAFLENSVDGENLAWAESRVDYQDITIRRGIAFVRNRYFIVADRIESQIATARTYSWRSHLWAGYEAGGAYAMGGGTINISRDKAGMALAITSTSGAPTFVEPSFVPLKAPHVHQFREQEEFAGNHAVVDADVLAASPDFLAVLAPHKVGAAGSDDSSPLTITPLAAGAGGAAWLIEGAGGREVAWIRKSTAPATLSIPGGPDIETDARVVIVSLGGPLALMAEGSFLKVDSIATLSGNGLPVQVKE